MTLGQSFTQRAKSCLLLKLANLTNALLRTDYLLLVCVDMVAGNQKINHCTQWLESSIGGPTYYYDYYVKGCAEFHHHTMMVLIGLRYVLILI